MDSLRDLSLEELQALAAQVGVGHAGLGAVAIWEKLVLEGTVG